jgi:UTP--glucose-1-phosphate uridylyltransferase
MENKPITKAVLACGGWSTRFLPTVKIYAKQLLPILDKPQILWVMEELVSAGITDFAIVHRDGENSLKHFFEPDLALDNYLTSAGKEKAMAGLKHLLSQVKNLQFFPQTQAFPYGNGSPILVSQSFIGSDPFVYLYADDLVIEPQPGAYLSSLISTFNRTHASAVCAAKEVPHQQISAYSSVKFKPNSPIPDQMESVVEKPLPEAAPSDCCLFGRFVFSPEIINILKNTPVSKGELWLTEAINHLAQTHTVIAECLPPGTDWITTGDPLNWLKANLTLALKDDRFSESIRHLLL